MLNAGYHAVPPGMIATVVTSLEMLELTTLRPETSDPNWREITISIILVINCD